LERATHAGRRFVDLLRVAGIAYERDRARYLAVAMIYYAIVSLIPLLLLLLATLGLLLRFSTIAADARQQMLLGVEASHGRDLEIQIFDGLVDILHAGVQVDDPLVEGRRQRPGGRLCQSR